jgi:galactokinase
MSEPLRRAFEQRFGGAPAGVLRAPGRVNLIGDHTDYHGLPVFPMAIQREIRIAYRPRADCTVRLESVQGFGPRSFELVPPIAPFPFGDWGNYAKAAAQALLLRHPELRGADLLVEGDIPLAAGLSSSSALVVACALALLEAAGIGWDAATLAGWMAEGERYVGTQGGGMDQTVCLCAKRGCALKIDFTPFAATPVPMPPDWVFVVAHSTVEAAKSAGAREHYNATRRRSQQALERTGAASYPALMASGAARALAAAAAMPEELRGPFRHTISEALRVEEAVSAMRSGEFRRFGELMVESHASLRDQLRVSCPEVDELVRCCLEGGAAGARVTGAGFGGCVVALSTARDAAALVEHLERTFYAGRRRSPDHAFIATPSEGAGPLA